MSLRVFRDTEKIDEVLDQILFENSTYYLDLRSFTDEQKEYWITRERLDVSINYHKENPIASIQFVNVVGNVVLFGTTFDVRSKKLRDGISGNDQYKYLLDAITIVSERMARSNFGISSATRINSQELNLPLDLDVFDYYYQATFNYPQGKNLTSFLNHVMSNPNFKILDSYNSVKIEKSKHVSDSFIKQIGKNSNYIKLDDESYLAQTRLARKIKEKTEESYFPSEILNVLKVETFDTPENRFIKFFLEEILNLCYRLRHVPLDSSYRLKIKEMINVFEPVSKHPIFKSIGRMKYMPLTSSVLNKKSGYRELYFHYVQSKLGFKTIVDDFNKEALNSNLKGIDTLYEVWVYYEMCKILFGESFVNQSFSGNILNYNDSLEKISVSNHLIKLTYNYSYSRVNRNSYSLILRPDISLEIGDKLFVFDAKYKFDGRRNNRDTQNTDDNLNSSEEILGYIKAEDIHKMHAYKDAIKNVESVYAIYPGDKFVFYDELGYKKIQRIDDITFKGVGAVPLSPINGNDILTLFLSKLLSYCEIE